MDTFNLQAAFTDYLKMCGLDINKMSPVQITETKRAFMAGCGFMFRAFGRTVDLDLETADDIIKHMELQLENFWKEEVNDHNNKG